MTVKRDFRFFKNIIPKPPIAIKGKVIASTSTPNHPEIPIYPTKPSKSVVPIFAHKIIPIACVNPKTHDPTNASVISAVMAELCKTAVVKVPVAIDHRLVLVKLLRSVLIALDVFAKPLSKTSKLNNKNPIHQRIVRRVVDIRYTVTKKNYKQIIVFFYKFANLPKKRENIILPNNMETIIKTSNCYPNKC